MMENKWLGDKSGQGFQKGEGDDGKTRSPLDLKTMEYGTQSKPKFATVGENKAGGQPGKKTGHPFCLER